MANNKKTKKQIERAFHKRAMKALQQKHHEKWSNEKYARRYVVSGGNGEEVCLCSPKAKTKRRQRRNGSGLRVGGR